MKNIFFILIFAVIAQASVSFAAPFVIPSVRPLAKKMYVVTADIPDLYHWTSIDSLQRLQAFSPGPKFPFEKVIAQETMVARSFPQLANKNGIFTWNNSIGGMGVSTQEMYEPETQDALIRLGMKKNLKILVVESVEGDPPIENLDLTGVDVIFHSRQWTFHEFIVINPDAIESFTADPDILRTDIEKEIDIFKSFKWADEDKAEQLDVTCDLFNHYGTLATTFNTLILPRIQAFLTNRVGIPTLFKAADSAAPSICEAFLK